jgi:hypothetical protein
VVAAIVVKFAGSPSADWKILVEQLPPFAEFYSKSDAAWRDVDVAGYAAFRNIALTND